MTGASTVLAASWRRSIVLRDALSCPGLHGARRDHEARLRRREVAVQELAKTVARRVLDRARYRLPLAPTLAAKRPLRHSERSRCLMTSHPVLTVLTCGRYAACSDRGNSPSSQPRNQSQRPNETHEPHPLCRPGGSRALFLQNMGRRGGRPIGMPAMRSVDSHLVKASGFGW